MELDKLWNNINEKADNVKLSDDSIINSKNIKSKDTIQKIYYRLKIKLGWSIVFTIIFSALLVYNFENLSLTILFALAVINFLISTLYTYYKMKKATNSDTGQNINMYLKNYYKQVVSLLKSEEISSIFLIPIFAVIGILIGGIVTKGSIEATLNDPAILIFAVILLITLVPLTIILVKWSNKTAFGKYLNKLKIQIDNLNEKE